jgi:hypothetical protein
MRIIKTVQTNPVVPSYEVGAGEAETIKSKRYVGSGAGGRLFCGIIGLGPIKLGSTELRH